MSEALGYSQGGVSTKIHLRRAEWSGKPMVFFVSEGQRNEMVGFSNPLWTMENSSERAADVRSYAPGASLRRQGLRQEGG
jgi:hypothetical protein